MHARNVASAKLDTARWSPTVTLFSYKEKERERTSARRCAQPDIFTNGYILWISEKDCVAQYLWITFRWNTLRTFDQPKKKIKHALYYYSVIAWRIIYNRIEFFGSLVSHDRKSNALCITYSTDIFFSASFLKINWPWNKNIEIAKRITFTSKSGSL